MNEPNATDQVHTEPEENEAPTGETENTANSTQSQWDAVASDFQRLGESIAEAFQSVWNNKTTQKQVSDLKEGLRSMSEQVGQVVDETRQNLSSEELKTEVRRAADDVKDFGSKVVTESKPVLLDVLKTLDDGLQSLITRLETRQQNATESEAPSPDVESVASADTEDASTE